MQKSSSLAALLILLTASGMAQELGFTDTPIIPGTQWHVHDSGRPRPVVVTPGEFPTPEKAGTPPSDAVVLFDGKDLSKWHAEKGGGPAPWKVEDGVAIPAGGYIVTNEEFGPDLQLHLEWASPNPPTSESQHRGNSGIFFFGRYEIQILDSYENPTYADGGATAIYGYMPPQVNASRKPGEWQTYDIIFEGPRFKDGKLEKAAIVTVLHNGVVTQNHTVLIGRTPHRNVGTYEPHGEKGPLRLQDPSKPRAFSQPVDSRVENAHTGRRGQRAGDRKVSHAPQFPAMALAAAERTVMRSGSAE